MNTRLTSITALAQRLVRAPSQGGIDCYDEVLDVLLTALTELRLTPVVLDRDGSAVGVFCTIDSGRPGPHIVLDGCLDTAATGDRASWRRDPFSGDIDDGWLYGRGAADSKTAIAVYAHLLADLDSSRGFAGRLTLLADLDEHTGGFAGIEQFLAGQPEVSGVIVGYPGCDDIVIGGRGFWRARVTVPGVAAHTGSSRNAGVSAVTRALRLAGTLEAAVGRERADGDFGLPPKLTVTSVRAGTPGVFSVVPDRAELELDVRLTPAFTADRARELVLSQASGLEELGASWPAFRLADDHPLPVALLAGARTAGLSPTLKVAGPSNIGCLLARRGIPATAGFGVRYVGLHAADEAVDLSTVPAVYDAHRVAVSRLLG